MEEKIEQIMIGALIQKPESFHEVNEIISEKDFKIDLYRHAYQTIKRMKENKEIIEETSLFLEMGRPNEPSRISAGIDDVIFEPMHYARQLRKRNLEDEIKRTAGEREFEITKEKIREIESLSKPLTLYNIQRMIEEKEDFNEFFLTGFTDLDEYLKFRAGSVMIIAGRPSVGKSSFGLSVLGYLAQYHPVGLVSFEMSQRDIGERISKMFPISYLSEINSNFVSVSPPTFTIGEIRKFIIETSRTNRPKVIMVDYLQLMHEKGRVESKRIEVGNLSKGMKELAKEFGVGMIVISSLSRHSDQRGENARPQMSDLKESGDIEYDADVIVLLHRMKNEDGRTELILEKNRMGKAKKIISLAWLENKVCFGNYAWQEPPLQYKED